MNAPLLTPNASLFYRPLAPCPEGKEAAPLQAPYPGSNPGLLWWLAAIILVVQTGCAVSRPPGSYNDASLKTLSYSAKPVPSMEERQTLGTVTIVTAQYVPNSNFVEFAEGPLAGAAKGGGLGLLIGTVVAGALVLNPLAAPVVIMELTSATAAGAAVGSAQGAQEAKRAGKKEEIKSAVDDAVGRLDAQHALITYMMKAAQKDAWIRLHSAGPAGPHTPDERPDYAHLKAEGIDTVLESVVREIGFEGCGNGFMEQNCPGGSNRPLVHLFIIGRARLVRVADGKELYANEFRYDSPPREFAQWSTNNAKALATELETGYRDLADRMHDELLMVTPIALPVPSYWLQPGDPLYLVCWLYPVFPAAEMKTFAQSFGEAFSKSRVLKPASGYPITPLLFTAVDSLTPLLRWSAFPRDIDREKLDPAVLARIRDITYDLQVWDVEQDCRGGLVYEYIGLTEPLHKIEKPLEPGRRYFWSFRARFTLDGQPMTTRWASLRYGSCDRDMITEETYYRFVTPKEQQ